MGSCTYDADMPNRPMSLTELTQQPQNPSIAPLQPQPTTDGNWCSDLKVTPPSGTTPAKVTDVNLWHDLPALNSGTVQFMTDGTYAVDLKFSEPGVQTHFTPYCLQYQGNVAIDCPSLGPQMAAFYMNAAGTHPVAFTNIACQLASDGGCDCAYDYSVEVTDSGTWLQGGGLIQESSSSYLYNGQAVMSQAPELSMFANYCQTGSSLILSGFQGSTLSSVVGLRTLSLTKM